MLVKFYVVLVVFVEPVSNNIFALVLSRHVCDSSYCLPVRMTIRLGELLYNFGLFDVLICLRRLASVVGNCIGVVSDSRSI